MSEEGQSSPPPVVRRRWLRRAKRLITVAVAVYLVGGIALYFIQPVLIFPGAYVHGGEGMVQPSADEELLHLQTAGGHSIAAIFGKAVNPDGTIAADAASRPTILFLYGNGDCIASSMEVFRSFRAMGANVLVPEYVGYPLSPGSPSDRGCIETADAAYAYLLTRPDVDQRQIYIVGRSIGGGPAIDLASRQPVAGLVTISAFTSLDEMAHKVVPIYPVSLVLRAHFDNADKVAAVRCPILLTHGTRDDFVPHSMMNRLAVSARAPVSVYSIDGANHNDVFLVGGGKLFDRILQFIDSTRTRPQTRQDR